MMKIIENVKSIMDEIETIKQNNNISYKIKICAATKYVGVKEMKELIDTGIYHLGENRVNDFLEKEATLKDEKIVWHFIGNLQSNKVKKIIHKIDYLHSLNRMSLAKAINKYREDVLNCFVEVNCSEEESKHGLNMEDVVSFIQSLEKYDKIRVIGLMTMAAYTNDEAIIRQTFKKLKMIQKKIIDLNLSYAPCQELSMGMSNDYKIAIEEGATIVRIGSRLFR